MGRLVRLRALRAVHGLPAAVRERDAGRSARSLGVFSLFGGLFIPISLLPSAMQNIAPFMPTYGVAAIARFPLVGGAFDPVWLLSVLVWTAVFGLAAMALFRRDTRRT